MEVAKTVDLHLLSLKIGTTNRYIGAKLEFMFFFVVTVMRREAQCSREAKMAKFDPTRIRKNPYLVVAVVLAFGSWMSQSYFLPIWDAQIRHLTTTQRLIETQFLEVTVWQLELMKRSSENPRNEELYRVAVFNLFRTLSQQLAWEFARVTMGEESVLHIRDKNERETAALTAFERKDTKALEKMLRGLNIIRTTNQPLFDQSFSSLIAKARENSDFWNWVFLLLYAVSAICFAMHWLSIEVKTAENRKISL